MKFTLNALLALAAASGVLAAPAPTASDSEVKVIENVDASAFRLAKRATQVYVCTDANFKGTCSLFHFNIGACVNFQGVFHDSISSFGPDPGYRCVIYRDSNCAGQSVSGIVYPGLYNLAEWGMNDAISSFRCQVD